MHFEPLLTMVSGSSSTIPTKRKSAAHYRLNDPAEVKKFLRALSTVIEKRQDMDARHLGYSGFDASQQGLREAMTTLGNGYFCTRGACMTAKADDTHYPGTYLAGGYNRLTSEFRWHPSKMKIW